MEDPVDYPELHGWTTKKTQIRIDIDEEVQEKLAAYDYGSQYVQRRRQSIRLSKQTQVEKD